MSSHFEHLGDGDEEEALPTNRSGCSGRISSEVLVRPALPGRKTHRSWYREQIGRRRREDVNQPEQEDEDRSQETSNISATQGSESGPADVFWDEVRSEVANTRFSEEDRESEEEEDAGEGGSGVVEVRQFPIVSPELPASGERRTSRREVKRARCVRRRQRKRPLQQQENTQSSPAETSCSSSSSSEEELVSDGLLCAVCLDLYLCPYMCLPCNHIFCEPCLRTLGKNCPSNTPCPLCRTTITHVCFQKELNQTVRTFFPKEYLSRKQNFQKASCAKWPLPSRRKLFRMLAGFPRQWSPMQRQFNPRDGVFRMDPRTLGDLEDLRELGGRSAAGWRLDMDMVIIYIYSVNWIIGFLIFCLLCYIFFPAL